VALLVRTYQLVALKYSLSAGDIGVVVGHHLQIQPRTRKRFVRAMDAWQRRSSAAARDKLLDAALAVLEELKAIVLAPAASVATENIYQKRHIAAGIPSIYGNYSEPKFDALGLSFRVETLVGRLLEDLVAEGIEPYVTRASLRRMANALVRFERALAVDGVDSRALEANLAMLQASFSKHNFTFHQYQNVFQFLVNSVTELSTTSVLSHDQVLHTVLIHDPRQCEARGMSVDAVAEMVLREVLVSALGMQALDRYVAAALRRISMLNGRLSSQALTRMMNYDPERLVSPLHKPRPLTDDQMTLGFKGLGLKQMASYGHNVPEGFVLSTELHGARPAMSYRPLYDDTIERIRLALGRLERRTGMRLGDRDHALLLSIRSGAAMSMPGLMSTFVDVGLNEELADALADERRLGWASWDSYRRFLQSWAMSDGIDRDVFDEIMSGFKVRYGVEQKLDFDIPQMRELALAYKERAREEGVEFVDDPFEQVVACIWKVMESWDSSHARLYRQYLGMAEEWGTAVVVQRMVFGNLNRDSGSGVTFTHNPLEPYSRQVRLFGDFTVCSQGEDLVGGLVFPLPISESQRLGGATYKGTADSLEKDYPGIYAQLLSVARELVGEREFDPQEIEFTFESPDPADLYVLQKRAVVQEQAGDAAYFDTSSPNYGPPAAVGMGVAGGAYSGRIAVSAEQIGAIETEAPDDNIVLLRPDTVPEDIAMITRVSAILTARGGATSHAAVTAKRLGKTAVVDCRDLEVIESRGSARLVGHDLRPGDWLSIDGRTGNIFFGRIPTTSQPEPPAVEE
jgi:pyruvate,orthophosphate dikinase